MNAKLTCLLWFLAMCVACSHLPSSPQMTDEQRLAVCTSQKYLRSNGYLDRVEAIDTSGIELEMWDKVKYEKNGHMDWASLLSDRQDKFSRKLHAVKQDNEDFLVIYRNDQSFSCVRVSADFRSIHLHEANCAPVAPVASVREDAVKCD